MQERMYPKPTPREKYLVEIKPLLQQLKQGIEEAEWTCKPCEDLKFEYDHVMKYHMQTGSHYYPNF